MKAPTVVWLRGGRPAVGSGGGHFGEHHGVITAWPHDPTMPSVQLQFVLLEFLAHEGVPEDAEWMSFGVRDLQDRA